MKRYIVLGLIGAVVVLLIPCAVNSRAVKTDETVETLTSADAVQQEEAETIAVFLTDEGKTEIMNMRDYIIGAVAAEMPAAYEEQALRAQAIACVTLARYMAKYNTDVNADGSVISSDSKTHQGYMSAQEMKLRWGDDFDKYYNKLCNAVDEVLNYAVTYNGELALTAFHAISSGKTESAENIWGKAVAYLTAVESEGDSLSSGYLSQVNVSYEELISAFPETADFSGDGSRVKKAEYTESGTLKSVTINGVNITGEALRSAFSLRSANITVSAALDGGIVCDVKGYGHGVGLSQYGADYYARQGYSWQDIIAHYYPGTQITAIADLV